MLSVIVTSTTLWCTIHYLFLLYARPGTHIHLTLHMHSNLVWQNHAILYCNIIGEILHLLSDVYIQNGLDSFCHIPQEDDIWVSILWAGTKISLNRDPIACATGASVRCALKVGVVLVNFACGLVFHEALFFLLLCNLHQY